MNDRKFVGDENDLELEDTPEARESVRKAREEYAAEQRALGKEVKPLGTPVPPKE